MNISSTARPARVIPNYTGPADSKSHYNPGAAKFIRPLNKAIVDLWMRPEIEGAENIPQDGAHMLCFNHESMSDASLVVSLTDRDYRFMAAKEQFTGPVGKAMTAMGAIPVDRGGTGQRESIETMIELMNEGKGTAIAPEGGIKADGQINEFKGGPALMAIDSKCETMVPVVLDYQPYQAGVVNKMGTYLAGGLAVAGGLAAAAFGGPIARGFAGALTGAVTGALAGGAAGVALSKEKTIRAKAEGGGLTGAGVGALLGAVTGAAGGVALGSSALYLAAPLSVVTGAATLGVAKAVNERKHARVIVGEGIPVEPYRRMENNKEARTKLTEDLRNRMLELHQKVAPKS